MGTGTLEAQTAEPELAPAERAWSAGERGRTPRVLAAAQAREKAEAAYELALECARNEQTPAATQSERDLRRLRAEAQQTWRDLYLEAERLRMQAEECWVATKQTMMARRFQRA